MDAIEAAEQPEVRCRLDYEIKDQLREIARTNKRSLAKEAERVLTMYVRDYREVDRG